MILIIKSLQNCHMPRFCHEQSELAKAIQQAIRIRFCNNFNFVTARRVYLELKVEFGKSIIWQITC